MSIAFICIYLYDNKMRVISTVKYGYEYIEGEDVKRYLITWKYGEYLKYGKHLREPRNNWGLF